MDRDSDSAPPTAAALASLLAQVWCELLGVSSVAPADDFFDLGGYSILAMRAVAQLRDELDVRISVRTLYENPRFDAFAACVEQARERA